MALSSDALVADQTDHPAKAIAVTACRRAALALAAADKDEA